MLFFSVDERQQGNKENYLENQDQKMSLKINTRLKHNIKHNRKSILEFCSSFSVLSKAVLLYKLFDQRFIE